MHLFSTVALPFVVCVCLRGFVFFFCRARLVSRAVQTLSSDHASVFFFYKPPHDFYLLFFLLQTELEPPFAGTGLLDLLRGSFWTFIRDRSVVLHGC